MATTKPTNTSDDSWEFVDNKSGLNEYGLTKLPGDDVCFPVAVVGIGCRMPGVETLTDYRDILIDGATTYGPIPEDRWNVDAWHDPDPTKLGHHVNKVAGLIPKFNFFDNLFFNTSPREAYAMDPHQYQVMEVSQMALDDAGITPATLPHNTAVYVSMRMGEMILTDCENRNIPNSHILTGGSHTTAANRVSFFYDIRGGSMGVEGACSAAIASIHFGAWSLWNKECDAVIAGGINLIWCPHFYVSQSHHGYLSASGTPNPFDASADGRVRSEAVGMVLLKPLADAIRDGDHVHCVIRGSSLSYHGNNASITLHTPESFKNSMSRVYNKFGVPLDKIKYVEAHATGNADEDVMEAKAIGELFGKDRKEPLKIGSVKANIGHAESAAGATSFIKACLMLSNKELYPQANFKELNPEIKAEELNLEVQQRYEKYTGEENLMVGLNVTSFAGQQCHMVLEEFNAPEKKIDFSDFAGWKFGDHGAGRVLPIPLSAKSPNALKDVARQWIEYKNDEEDAQVVTSWLATRHDHYINRMVVMANSSEDLKSKLAGFIAGEQSDFIVEGKARPNFDKPKICFVFPGQGQQWWHMGRQLYALEPVYRDIIDQCDKVWQKCSGYSFLDKEKVFISSGYEDADPSGVDATLAALVAIVANQLALHELMVHWGVKPDMVVGHSLGEASAIYAAGGMTLEECITNIYIRATSQNKVSGTGTMAAARFTPEDAAEFCSRHEDIYVACMNSTGNVTLGGGIPTVKRLCAENPTKLKEIRVNSAFHTPHMRPVKEEFVSRLEEVYQHRMARDDTTLYSTVTGDVYQGPYDPAYWWENLGHRVNFVDACKSILRDHGSDVIFLEIGASATLLGNVRQTAKFMNCNPEGYVNCGMRNKDDRVVALKAAGVLHGMGFPISWANITRNCGKYIQLPTYPFQGNFYRLESELFRKKRLWQYEQTYKSEHGEINIQTQPFLTDYQLNGKHVMPAASYVEYLAELDHKDQTRLKNIKVNAAIPVPQRTRNGSYESIWVVPAIDGKQVVLHERNQKAEQASAEFEPNDDEDDALVLDIEAIDDACHRTIRADDIYEKFSRAGLEYGSQFKVVKEVKTADAEAVGYISSHTSRHEVIQTVTLDGAFQVVLAAFSKGAPYTVTEIGSLKMLVDKIPVQDDLVVYSRLADWQLEAFRCDISIADLDGNVLLLAQDVLFKNVALPHVDIQSCVYTTSLRSLDSGSLKPKSDKAWVILREERDAALADALQNNLPAAVAMSKRDFRAFESKNGIDVIYVWNKEKVHRSSDDEGDNNALKTITKLLEEMSSSVGQSVLSLWIVTLTDTTSANLDACLVQGYIRAMSNKLSIPLRWVSVMDSPDKERMAAEVTMALTRAGEKDCELIVHKQNVWKPVVSKFSGVKNEVKSRDWEQTPGQGSGFKSVTAGKLDAKEVRIRVRAISRAHQGLLQCAGIVEDIGEGVTSTNIGDAVLGLMCSSIASIATCKEEYVVPKPEKLTWADASAFGFTTAVAYHALKDRIKMKAGDVVYVTEAEKPLGQAVVRVAKALGGSVMCSGDPTALAKMFGVVTVVNPTSVTFNRDVLQHTGGRGLDVAINTNGQNVPQTLLDCTRVAGKVAIMGFTPVRVVADPKVTTCVINARDFIHRRPSRLLECVTKAVDLLETGDLMSTELYTMPVTNTGGQNMVSVEIPAGFVPDDLKLPKLALREDATYMVAGGFGNIGLQVASWLGCHGAKHIALVSPHGKTSSQVAYEVEHLKEDNGVEVYEIKANLGNPKAVKMVFETLRRLKTPQVAGVFHAAASMSDVTKHSDESVSRLIDSQAKSAEYFHEETKKRSLKLDYFVTFSSTASLLGLPKMEYWCAVTNALDDLATLRRRQGLSSLSLQMGPVSGVGYMERHPETARILKAAGTRPLIIQQYLEVLETLLQTQDHPPVVAVTDQDWNTAAGVCPGSRGKFEDMVSELDQVEAKKIRRATVQRRLVEFLGDELYWPYQKFHEDVPLTEYGLDLILSRALFDWLRKEFHVDAEFKAVQDGVTLRDLVNQIMSTEA